MDEVALEHGDSLHFTIVLSSHVVHFPVEEVVFESYYLDMVGSLRVVINLASYMNGYVCLLSGLYTINFGEDTRDDFILVAACIRFTPFPFNITSDIVDVSSVDSITVLHIYSRVIIHGGIDIFEVIESRIRNLDIRNNPASFVHHTLFGIDGEVEVSWIDEVSCRNFGGIAATLSRNFGIDLE